MEELNEEQIAELKEKAAKVDELEKSKGESDTKLKEYDEAKAAWEKEKAELSESANPNWQKARARMTALEGALKDKGVELNEDGSVKSNPQNVDVEALKNEARQAARGELLSDRLSEHLGEYDTESAKMVKHFYQKLTAGEDVNLQNMGKFVKLAASNAETEMAGEFKRTKAAQFSGGQGPRQGEEGVLDESKRQELGQLLGLNFVKKSNNK